MADSWRSVGGCLKVQRYMGARPLDDQENEMKAVDS